VKQRRGAPVKREVQHVVADHQLQARHAGLVFVQHRRVDAG
jgi:hypothetical protein